jgi:hypothetical protein
MRRLAEQDKSGLADEVQERVIIFGGADERLRNFAYEFG